MAGIAYSAHATALAEIAALRKAWALFVIDLWRAGSDVTVTEPTVYRLASEHADEPIGECDACRKRAPLRTLVCGGSEGEFCSWGC